MTYRNTSNFQAAGGRERITVNPRAPLRTPSHIVEEIPLTGSSRRMTDAAEVEHTETASGFLTLDDEQLWSLSTLVAASPRGRTHHQSPSTPSFPSSTDQEFVEVDLGAPPTPSQIGRARTALSPGLHGERYIPYRSQPFTLEASFTASPSRQTASAALVGRTVGEGNSDSRNEGRGAVMVDTPSMPPSTYAPPHHRIGSHNVDGDENPTHHHMRAAPQSPYRANEQFPAVLANQQPHPYFNSRKPQARQQHQPSLGFELVELRPIPDPNFAALEAGRRHMRSGGAARDVEAQDPRPRENRRAPVDAVEKARRKRKCCMIFGEIFGFLGLLCGLGVLVWFAIKSKGEGLHAR